MKLQINLCALALLLMISFTAMAQSKTKAKAKAKKEVAIQLYSVRDILNKVDNKDGKCDAAYIPVWKPPIIIMESFTTELPTNLKKM